MKLKFTPLLAVKLKPVAPMASSVVAATASPMSMPNAPLEPLQWLSGAISTAIVVSELSSVGSTEPSRSSDESAERPWY